ncbi:MAG TPA: phage holin family protein [Acidimicrobiia bacterium]|jgi:hypothetical protein
MGDSRPSGAGLGVLAIVALVVCCAAPVLISAGVLAAIGTWLCNAIVIAVAAVLVAGAVVYAFYRRRRGAACPPSGTDASARDRDREQA